MTIRCRFCGAVNTIPANTASTTELQPEPAQTGSGDVTEETMRGNIIRALKTFYPRYRGYNGGYLAPVREPNPDLFMRVLTKLERNGIIEYNDTQIALRLSETFMKRPQEVA